MIDNIWSGWRSKYISDLYRRPPGDTHRDRVGGDSIFRQILESGLDDDETFIVHRGSLVFTIMNSFPYAVGHVLVLPYRQVADIGDLDSAERVELWVEVDDAVRALRSVLSPDGFNVGLNLGPAAGGSVSEHLHVHVVPRWFGDANFTVTTASVKAIPEALDVTASKVRRAWNSDENGHQRRSASMRETNGE